MIGDERQAFKRNDFRINEDDVIPWATCSERHLSKVDQSKLEGVLLTLENSQCLDLKEQKISGGTNPTFPDLVQKTVVIKLQYCDFYTHTDIECASKEETDRFLNQLTFDWKVTDNYIYFDEPETEKAIKAEVVEIGRFHAKDFNNTNWDVKLKLIPVLGKFYDDWMSIGGLFTSDVEKEYIEYNDVESFPGFGEYAFGFNVQLTLDGH